MGRQERDHGLLPGRLLDFGYELENRNGLVRSEIENGESRRGEGGDGPSRDVVHIGEIARLSSITKEGQGLSFKNGPREEKRRHVGAPAGAISREVTKHTHIETVKVMVGIREVLRGLL